MLEGDNAMVSHHFFSQLVLLALLWLFVILHLSRPKRPVTAPAVPALPEPLKPKRPRSNEPKPFEGLTHKPHCALCEQDIAYPKAPPPVPPDPMAPTHRRPREIDTSRHFCPHAGCEYRGVARSGQSARQRSSQWRPLAAVPLYLLSRVHFGNAWHHLPR